MNNKILLLNKLCEIGYSYSDAVGLYAKYKDKNNLEALEQYTLAKIDELQCLSLFKEE